MHRSHSRLAIIYCTVPIAMVAQFQFRPEKKRYSRLSVVTPFQIRPEKRYSHLAIIHCAVPIAIVALFQLRPEKKTVVCPLLRHSDYDRKKKIRSSGHHSLRCSDCHGCAVLITTGKKKIQSSVCCYAIPITTRKKKYTCLSVVTPSQLQPEKKDTVV